MSDWKKRLEELKAKMLREDDLLRRENHASNKLVREAAQLLSDHMNSVK